MIETEDLVVEYGARTALAGVSMEVREREIFGVLGPNGGGKSTLFRVLATMLEPTRGRARVAGFDVEREATEVRRRSGGAEPQSHAGAAGDGGAGLMGRRYALTRT